MRDDKYFIIDYDTVVAENLSEQDFISYAYEMWFDDWECKDNFDEPDDLGSALEYLEDKFNIIKGKYL